MRNSNIELLRIVSMVSISYCERYNRLHFAHKKCKLKTR